MEVDIANNVRALPGRNHLCLVHLSSNVTQEKEMDWFVLYCSGGSAPPGNWCRTYYWLLD